MTALYRAMKRLNIKFYKVIKIKDTGKKRHYKKYDTPDRIGVKWQIDVKYVPKKCKTKDNEKNYVNNYTNIKKYGIL